MRYSSPIIQFRRTVARDCELNGHPLRAGDEVVLFYNSANRDEAVFADPDTVRHHPYAQPARRLRRRWPHFCLGAALARQEMAVLFRELYTRLPDLRSIGAPELIASSFDNRVGRLPFTYQWTVQDAHNEDAMSVGLGALVAVALYPGSGAGAVGRARRRRPARRRSAAAGPPPRVEELRPGRRARATAGSSSSATSSKTARSTFPGGPTTPARRPTTGGATTTTPSSSGTRPTTAWSPTES